MAHGLADRQFRSYEDIEKCLDSWIASKDEHFYRDGIRALPERWAKVVANDGQYTEKQIRRYRHNCGSLTYIILEIYRKLRFACISSVCMCIPNI